MKSEKITDSRDAESVIEQFKNRSTESNCYLLPDDLQQLVTNGLLQVCIDDSNAFFLEEKGNCLRIHYLINDFARKFPVEADKPLMLEILFREAVGEPSEAVEYWTREGFRRNLVRRNLTAKFSEFNMPVASNCVASVSTASSDVEACFARQLFNSSFDPYSGDFITKSDADEMMKSGQLLTAYDSEQIVGALNFYTIGRCVWLGHVAVDHYHRGQGVGFALVKEYIRRNHVDDKTRYSLWVQEQNVAATNMYDRLGFKYAGKSSLSMIRE